jgi:hypothetical protein
MWVGGMVRFFRTLGNAWRANLYEALEQAEGATVTQTVTEKDNRGGPNGL